mmetsp:Transcript_8259/g.27391  ORF Transcript_8259/g.27391 Transcript_8259/m.27391 type:complete len:284 (-) Transcript_8259:41-892(-)
MIQCAIGRIRSKVLLCSSRGFDARVFVVRGKNQTTTHIRPIELDLVRCVLASRPRRGAIPVRDDRTSGPTFWPRPYAARHLGADVESQRIRRHRSRFWRLWLWWPHHLLTRRPLLNNFIRRHLRIDIPLLNLVHLARNPKHRPAAGAVDYPNHRINRRAIRIPTLHLTHIHNALPSLYVFQRQSRLDPLLDAHGGGPFRLGGGVFRAPGQREWSRHGAKSCRTLRRIHGTLVELAPVCARHAPCTRPYVAVDAVDALEIATRRAMPSETIRLCFFAGGVLLEL